MEYRTNGHQVFKCTYHVVFCPKYRRKVLVNGVDVRLKQILPEVAAETRCKILEMEVMPDHVHLLLDVDPQIGIRFVVAAMKGRSSRVLRSEFKWLTTRLPCLWTRSTFISTVGGAPLAVVKKYIEDQKVR